jgi:hypothetical protein
MDDISQTSPPGATAPESGPTHEGVVSGSLNRPPGDDTPKAPAEGDEVTLDPAGCPEPSPPPDTASDGSSNDEPLNPAPIEHGSPAASCSSDQASMLNTSISDPSSADEIEGMRGAVTTPAAVPVPATASEPAASCGSDQASMLNTSISDPSSDDEIERMWGAEAIPAAVPEPATSPEPAALIQEIQRGEDVAGSAYYLFLLWNGSEILLSGEQLTDGLKPLKRIVATRGRIINAQHNREIMEQLQSAPLEMRFLVLHKAGWYNQIYVMAIGAADDQTGITPIRVYGKHALRIFLSSR